MMMDLASNHESIRRDDGGKVCIIMIITWRLGSEKDVGRAWIKAVPDTVHYGSESEETRRMSVEQNQCREVHKWIPAWRE